MRAASIGVALVFACVACVACHPSTVTCAGHECAAGEVCLQVTDTEDTRPTLNADGTPRSPHVSVTRTCHAPRDLGGHSPNCGPVIDGLQRCHWDKPDTP